MVIDNRPGGGGTIGMAVAAKMPPDGYTLVLGVSSYVVMAPGVYSRLTYDPVRDFAPVTQILSAPLILLAHPSLPARDATDFVRAIRLPDVAERFTAEAGEIVAGTPDAFGAFIVAELAKWARVARASGTKVE